MKIKAFELEQDNLDESQFCCDSPFEEQKEEIKEEKKEYERQKFLKKNKSI